VNDAVEVRNRIKRLAWLLDASWRVPGMRARVGFDALVGLIPGIGDLIGTALSGWIIVQARRAGVPSPVVARMVGNVAIEALVGLVPVLGDLFDAGWKANLRNIALFDRWLEGDELGRGERARSSTPASRGV
jgi:hypothetical protein